MDSGRLGQITFVQTYWYQHATAGGYPPVVVDVRTAPLTFLAASDGKTYTSDFTVLVRFLDQRNVVARKVSQHYEIKGPIAGLESAKNGEVIFYRQPELAAGVYTMESIGYDAPSGKSSVRFSTVEVTLVRPETLRMSSLVLVKGGEKVRTRIAGATIRCSSTMSCCTRTSASR